MKVQITAALLLGSALVLPGCTTGPAPAEVTRFHLDQPIAPGEVAIEPKDPTLAGSLEFQSYAGAIAAELQKLGFRIAPSLPRSELVAVVDVGRDARQSGPSEAPASIGLGGGGFGGSVGGGIGISFPIGKKRTPMVVQTRLAVQLKRRSEGTVIWEGRAMTQAKGGTPQAEQGYAVRRLAAAMFQGFPGESGTTITVK